jgi:hypothetical protein
MSYAVFWANAFHDAFVMAVVHFPSSHVVVRRIVYAAVPTFALIWRMGDKLFQIRLFVR